jgi:hypothetical protein
MSDGQAILGCGFWTESMLLTHVLPKLAVELEQLLREHGELELAAQVPTLAIVDRCRCGDHFCASFYTLPKPEGAYGPDLRTLDLDAARGTVILDIVSSLIAHVEVLNRDEVRRSLLTALP